MHAVSQIIERNLDRREHCRSGLWVNPEQDLCWHKAKNLCDSLKLCAQERGAYNFLQQTGADIEFLAFPQPGGEKYQWIILNLPRQKALLRMMLDCAANLLSNDGVLWLAGENRAGIKSADKLLKQYFGQVRKLDNARHCNLFEARQPLEQRKFDPTTHRIEWPLECGSQRLRIMSYPGVFAHGRVDAGSALLLETLSGIPLQGEVLDFGCGAGLIGACMAASNTQARVTLLDNSALALLACEETLAANKLHGTTLASDGLEEVTTAFDVIVSNPPIHAGVKTDNRLSIRLLKPVYDHLNPGGMLLMVANVHLPYENWLRRGFSKCSELAANANFKVIMALK